MKDTYPQEGRMRTVDQYILSIDQGTTSSRAILVDQQGTIVGSHQKEFRQIFPQEGWVEHDANEIWSNVQSVIAGVFISTDIPPEAVAGIGITNQRETTVIWDKKTGEPIYNAIVWQSRQSAEIANQLIEQGHLETIQERTGLVVDAYFSATKIRWILDQIPGAQERAEAGELLFGTIDTWLIYRMTKGKVHKTDYTNAQRTMLFNIHELDWDDFILDLLDIPRALLPTVHTNSEIYGMAENLPYHQESVPIAGVVGDQQAALFGQRAFEPGMVKNTYGTGSFMIMNTGSTPQISQHQLLTTIAYALDDQVIYALEGSIFVSGSAIQWLRDELQIIGCAEESEALAQEATSDDIYVVPAFTGLGAPYWNSKARGSIFGLTRGSSRADLVKATLQSLAYQVKDVADTMEKDSGLPIQLIKVDGGAAKNNYLLQFQADITGIDAFRVTQLEMTALGAAYLAGLSVGFWKDLDEIATLPASGDHFQPQMEEACRKKLYQGWTQAVKATELFSERDA